MKWTALVIFHGLLHLCGYTDKSSIQQQGWETARPLPIFLKIVPVKTVFLPWNKVSRGTYALYKLSDDQEKYTCWGGYGGGNHIWGEVKYRSPTGGMSSKGRASASMLLFGLDIIHLRDWFERQLQNECNGSGFGKSWVWHIIPVTYFDFCNEDDLRLWLEFHQHALLSSLDSENDNVHALNHCCAYFQRIYQDTDTRKISQRLHQNWYRKNQPDWTGYSTELPTEKGHICPSIMMIWAIWISKCWIKGRSVVDEIQREMDLIRKPWKAGQNSFSLHHHWLV